MKFNKHLSPEVQELLTAQYEQYIKETQMTKKEMRVLREWVKDGHSVYENSAEVWADGQVPAEFLTIYREEEYIRHETKGMNPEDTRKFAMTYYGWDDIKETDAVSRATSLGMELSSPQEELPFS